MERSIKSDSPIMQRVYKRWALRYLAWVLIRYRKFARGGGDWPGLAASTKAARRGRGGAISILIDIGAMFAAMDPSVQASGSIRELIKDGIRVGYGGNSSHPSSNTTIAEIAEFHHRGLGNNPVRKVVVEPDASVRRGMVDDLDRGIKELENAGPS